MKKTPRYELGLDELGDIYTRVSNGQSISEVARLYKKHHTTILYYIRKLRENNYTFNGISYYSVVFEKKNTGIKNYKDYLDDSIRRKKQAICTHTMWIKRCSCCGFILESDAKYNASPSFGTFISETV